MHDSHLYDLMHQLNVPNYRALHQWSVDNREAFWKNTVARLGVVFKEAPHSILAYAGAASSSATVEKPGWLSGAKLNIADSCFTAPATQTAVVWRDEADPAQTLHRITYGDLLKLTNRISNGLVAAGFKKGEAIAIDMPMTMESVAIYLGIVRAGMVAVSIADSFPAIEIEKRFRISHAVAAFTVESFVRAGKKLSIYKEVIAAKAPKVIVIPASGPYGTVANLREGDLAWAQFLSPNDHFVSIACDPLTSTNVLFSSGTTGDPKAIPWTHLTPIKAAMDGYYHQDIHQGDTVCWPTNIGWMMGPWLIYQLVNRATLALFYGAPAGAKFGKFVQDAGVTMLGTIPTMVKSWLSTRLLDPFDWSRIRCFSSTGECSHPDEIFYLMNMTNFAAPVIEYCGGTEIGGGYITSTLIQDHAPSTFTTAALGLELAVLGPDHKLVSEDAHGEVYIIPPSIGLSEVLMNRDHHKEYFLDVPVDPTGKNRPLRRHGDEIMVLSHGYYQAMGRADDTMKLGGVKVGSAELERAMQVHKLVHEVAAVGVQPSAGQTSLVAFVVPKPGFIPPAGFQKTLSAELQVLIRERLNPLFKLNDVVVVESIPKTPTNKIMRRILRDQYVKSKQQQQPKAKL